LLEVTGDHQTDRLGGLVGTEAMDQIAENLLLDISDLIGIINYGNPT
jgi:hypothetical protein